MNEFQEGGNSKGLEEANDQAKNQGNRVELTTSAATILSTENGNLFNSLKRYRKEEVIKQDTFTRLFRGIDTLTGQPVAIKFTKLPGKLRTYRHPTNEFRNRINFLKNSNHPHILPVLDYDVWETSVEVILEYIPNSNLGDELNRQGGYFEEQSVAHYLRQILDGLNFIHANSGPHASLRWENILIDQEGSVRLSDMWVLKEPIHRFHSKADATIEELFFANIQLLPPNWLAPELVTNQPVEATNESDVWAVGCIAIEMLSNQKPFESGSREETLSQIRANKPPRMPQRISPECRSFLQKCLYIDPTNRYNASQLLAHPFIQRTSLSPELQQDLVVSRQTTSTVLRQSFIKESIHSIPGSSVIVSQTKQRTDEMIPFQQQSKRYQEKSQEFSEQPNNREPPRVQQANNQQMSQQPSRSTSPRPQIQVKSTGTQTPSPKQIRKSPSPQPANSSNRTTPPQVARQQPQVVVQKQQRLESRIPKGNKNIQVLVLKNSHCELFGDDYITEGAQTMAVSERNVQAFQSANRSTTTPSTLHR